MIKRDLMGHKMGYLEVIGPARTIDGRAQWECRCICGKIVPVSGQSLTRKDPKRNTRSCGCMRETMYTETILQRREEGGMVPPRIDGKVERKEERDRRMRKRAHIRTVLVFAEELTKHINWRKANHVPFTHEVHRLSESLTEALRAAKEGDET